MPLQRARLRISDYNTNRKNRLKNQERSIRQVSLSLTSMVDMFAVLVIFLLLNTSTVAQWIEVSQGIELPKASGAEPPQKAVTIQISREAILGEQKPLVKFNEFLAGSYVNPILRAWLAKMDKKDGHVNIVAHEKVPFGVVRRVIATCQESGFGKVNLAVQPK
jgi:biopolymer transport protein TolR